MSSFFLPVKGSSRERKRKKIKQDKKVSSIVQILQWILVSQTVMCDEVTVLGVEELNVSFSLLA